MARVTVCVRKRPLSAREVRAGDRDVVTVQAEMGGLCVHELKEKVDLTKYVDTHAFQFDRVFGEHATNDMVYSRTARPLVDVLFQGGRATCFAYGQTGAGKTYTMAGGRENPGLYTLAVKDVFSRIRLAEKEIWRQADAEGIEDFEPPEPAQVWIGFYEIYASRLQDLLNRSKKMECREDSNQEVQIVGLTERLCGVEEEVLDCIHEGSANRCTGVTGANDDSSRSHAVFQIVLRHPPSAQPERDQNSIVRSSLLRATRSRTAAAANAKRGAEIGRLCFIDLAGSERGSDTASSTRQTRMEGAEINKSLLALKECIRAMDQKKDHTPFRGSKLTQVLKASFIGKNCSTVMIANISPASSNVEHTLNTLRYSDRVKEIKRSKIPPPPPELEFSLSKSTMGGRRATFSHGIGLRSGRGHMGAPLRSTQRQASFDAAADDSDKYSISSVTERKASRSQHRLKEEKNGGRRESVTNLRRAGSMGSPRRGIHHRSRGRDSEQIISSVSASVLADDTQSEGGARMAKKSREAKTTRRRTQRTPSLIPSRPSIGGGSLMTPHGSSAKLSVDGRMTRKNSKPKTKAGSSIDLSRPPIRADRATRPAGPTTSHPKRARLSTEGEMARARTAEMMKSSSSSSGSGLTRTPSQGSSRSDGSKTADGRRLHQVSQALAQAERTVAEAMKEKEAHIARGRTGTNGNAAQSAMNYYMLSKKQDELQEEDVLFASIESSIDEAAAAERERLAKVSAEVMVKEAVKVRREPDSMIEPPSTSSGLNALPRRLSIKNEAGTSPLGSEETPSGTLGTLKSEVMRARVSAELRKVLRFHHVQIEELMRLTEADVALVNAAERGDMDADEYALKLKLNLSQKMDIVAALQNKLKLLD